MTAKEFKLLILASLCMGVSMIGIYGIAKLAFYD
jgi:hypothetical protein